jgi:hypothetical protein
MMGRTVEGGKLRRGKQKAAREIVRAVCPIALAVLVDCTATLPGSALVQPNALGGIFVCDMPGSNCIMLANVALANLSQMAVKARSLAAKRKMAPEAGAIVQITVRLIAPKHECPIF